MNMATPVAALTALEVSFPRELLVFGPLGMKVWCPTGIEVPMMEEVSRANVPGWNLMMSKPPLDVALSDGVLPVGPVLPVEPEVKPEDELPEDDNYNVKINPETGERTITPKPTPEGRPPPPPYDPDVNWTWDEAKGTYVPSPKKTDARPGAGEGQEGRELPPPPSAPPAGAAEGSGDWVGVVDNSQFRWKWMPRPPPNAYAPETAKAWGAYVWRPAQQSFNAEGRLVTTSPGQWTWFERAGTRPDPDNPQAPNQIIYYDVQNNRYVVFPGNRVPGVERSMRSATDTMLPAQWGVTYSNESQEARERQDAAKDVDFWDYLKFMVGGAVFDSELRNAMATNLQNWATSNGYTEEQLNLDGGFLENVTTLAGLSWGALRGQGISPDDTWGKIGATIVSDGLLGFATGSPWKLATSLATAVADEIVTWRDKRSNFDKFKSLVASMAYTVLSFKAFQYGGRAVSAGARAAVRSVVARSAQRAVRAALQRAEVAVARRLAAYSQYLPRGAADRIYRALGYSGAVRFAPRGFTNASSTASDIRSLFSYRPVRSSGMNMNVPPTSRAMSSVPRAWPSRSGNAVDESVFTRNRNLMNRVNAQNNASLTTRDVDLARRAAQIRREAARASAWVEQGQRLQSQRTRFITFPAIANEAARVARNRLLRSRASLVGAPIWRGGD